MCLDVSMTYLQLEVTAVVIHVSMFACKTLADTVGAKVFNETFGVAHPGPLA
jgi:hypothetical protein